MTRPSEKTLKQLYALSGNECAFPECTQAIVDIETGQVIGECCHIKGQSAGGPRYDPDQSVKERHAVGNLILFCPNHHNAVDGNPDIYSVELLLDMKDAHQKLKARPEQPQDAIFGKLLYNKMSLTLVTNNTGNVAINSSNVVQNNVVHIRSQNKTVQVEAPLGTIGRDQRLSRYAAHLIERYNEFASSMNRPRKFNHGAISNNIKQKFGAQWRLLPAKSAPLVFEYLQGRIDKTIIGKNKKARGEKAYSTFEEYCAKYKL